MPKTESSLALSSSLVIHGKARFTVLTDRLLRLEYDPEGRFEDRPTLAVENRRFPACTFSSKVAGATLRLDTSTLKLQYQDNGRGFTRDNLQVEFSMGSERVRWHPGKRDAGNLKGAKRTLDSHHGNLLWHKGKQKLVPAPEEDGLLSREGWTVFDESNGVPLRPRADGSLWPAASESGKEKWDGTRVSFKTTSPAYELLESRAVPSGGKRSKGGPQAKAGGLRKDLYLFAYGRDYTAALRDAAHLLGRQPLPPRFAFGYWWSRWWAYTDYELRALVGQFDAMDIPIDVLVVDMDWHRKGWTGYSWDPDFFPQPGEFLAWKKAQGLKLAPNLHPAGGVGRQERGFEAMCEDLDLDPNATDRIPFDCGDPRYMDAYFKRLHHPLEDEGVDFWWMDWQQGRACSIPGVDPLPWLNRLHWHDMAQRRPERRPLVFSRYGGLGAGRYPVGFSGDTERSWRTLKYLLRFTAQSANSLFGYWSHDVGGFFNSPFGGQLTPELYTRWVQAAALQPVFRTHAGKSADGDRRFWLYGEPFGSLMAEALRRRYALVPYIYTEARLGHDTGISLCRPMYYGYPEQDAAYRTTDQYFFGDSLLAAPVAEPMGATGTSKRRLWLPPGLWYDVARGLLLRGEAQEGSRLETRFLLGETPLFAKAGAVLPCQPPVRRLSQGSYPGLIWEIYPGADGAYALYEDDGLTTGYLSGKCAWIRLHHEALDGPKRDGRHIRIAPADGDFEGFLAERPLVLRLSGQPPPARVVVQGRELPFCPAGLVQGANEGPSWSYDGHAAAIVVRWPDWDARRAFEATVEGTARRHGSAVQGLPGLFRRCQAAFDTLRIAGDRGLDRPLAALTQIPQRLSRDPAAFASELTSLDERLRAAESGFAPILRALRRKEGKESESLAGLGRALACLRAARTDWEEHR